MWQAQVKVPHPDLSEKRKIIAMKKENMDLSKRYLALQEKNQKLQRTINKQKFSNESQKPSQKLTRSTAKKRKAEPKPNEGNETDFEDVPKPAKMKRGQKLKQCSESGCSYETTPADSFKQHLQMHER